jgi:site-specific recombinase XerD
MNTLAAALQQYFTSYARAQRDLSPNTIAAYRDTWRMLITHLTGTLGIPAGKIDFQALDAERVTAFLDHLEQARSNSVSTRNARLTAIRAVLTHAQPNYPEHAATITRILAIPPKRHPKPILEFLSTTEANALLAAPARTTWTGIRDHALFALDLQTGLRVSELLSLTTASIHLGTGAHVTCTGKGRPAPVPGRPRTPRRPAPGHSDSTLPEPGRQERHHAHTAAHLRDEPPRRRSRHLRNRAMAGPPEHSLHRRLPPRRHGHQASSN